MAHSHRIRGRSRDHVPGSTTQFVVRGWSGSTTQSMTSRAPLQQGFEKVRVPIRDGSRPHCRMVQRRRDADWEEKLTDCRHSPLRRRRWPNFQTSAPLPLPESPSTVRTPGVGIALGELTPRWTVAGCPHLIAANGGAAETEWRTANPVNGSSRSTSDFHPPPFALLLLPHSPHFSTVYPRVQDCKMNGYIPAVDSFVFSLLDFAPPDGTCRPVICICFLYYFMIKQYRIRAAFFSAKIGVACSGRFPSVKNCYAICFLIICTIAKKRICFDIQFFF
jgi:hypothetical protein